MTPNLRSSSKNPLTSEQEMLEDRIRRMEELARMTGLVETLIHNQSPPLLLTDAEHVDVLRARHRVDDAAADLRTAGNVTATLDEGSSGGDPARETHHSRRRKNAPAQKSNTRSGGPQLPTDPAGPLRPATEGGTPSQPGSVFTRLGLLPRDATRKAPVHAGAIPEDARLPVRERLREESATTATSRQTETTQDFSPAEIERIHGILGEPSCDGILDGDFTPLTEALLATPIPDRLRLPKVCLFDGSGNPSDYLGVYSSWARAYGYPEAI